MRKNIGSNLFICLLVTILVLIISYSKDVMESVSFSISIWKDNLFPSLFPFFIISNLLLQYGFINKISLVFKNIMPRIFHLPKEASFPLVISLFSGFPSGAKATSDLVKRKILTTKEAERLLTFTHYSNPVFVLGFIGNIIFGNQKIGLIILISHILSNLLVGYIFRLKPVPSSSNIIKENKEMPSLGNALRVSIFDSLNTMFLLLGIVTIFLMLTTIIFEFLSFGPFINTLIAGLCEMTQVVKLVSELNLNIILKIIIITFFISFGGISIHIQVLSIISEEKIKYKYFLLARILHGIIASILVFILYLLLF